MDRHYVKRRRPPYSMQFNNRTRTDKPERFISQFRSVTQRKQPVHFLKKNSKISLFCTQIVPPLSRARTAEIPFPYLRKTSTCIRGAYAHFPDLSFLYTKAKSLPSRYLIAPQLENSIWCFRKKGSEVSQTQEKWCGSWTINFSILAQILLLLAPCYRHHVECYLVGPSWDQQRTLAPKFWLILGDSWKNLM